MMAQPGMFVRKASGLVRSWSVFDGFVYSFFSINLVTLGFYIFSFAPYLPEANLVTAVVVSGILIIFEVFVYALLVAVMPRAGGDYVWQSRILGGGIGFVLAITGWAWILWHWVPLYGNMLAYNVFTPILGVLSGWTGSTALYNAASWFVTTNGFFVSSLVVIVLASIYVSLGMSWYARIQKFCFYIGMAGIVTMIIMMIANSQSDFIAGFNHYANSFFAAGGGDVYKQILDASAEAGYTAAPINKIALGSSMALIPMVVFFNLWPNWGATLYGEVRGASDFRRNFWSMAAALIATTILAVIVLMLIAKVIGWDFYNAANLTFYEGTSPFGAFPYPALLVSFLTDSPVLQMWLLISMSAWFFGWCGTVFLSSTRVIFAAAFDRILPEWMARVSTKFRSPVNALLVMAVGGVIISAGMHYTDNLETMALNSTVVIAVTYLGTTIAAIILPYKDPELYRASPIARLKLFGVPLITVTGIIFLAFLLFLFYMWATDAVYGVNEPVSYIYMAILYLISIIIYNVSKIYRRKQGINLDEIHKNIPVE
ncbi:MAG: APC family permease [Bacillota bacterium]|nr:APC family permease [Bacillota bacterium]